MMKPSHVALTTAVVAGITIASAGELFAVPLASDAVAIGRALPAAATDVRCGEFLGACRPYWGYSRGYRAYPGYAWGYSGPGYGWGYSGYDGDYRPYSNWSYPAYSYGSYGYR